VISRFSATAERRHQQEVLLNRISTCLWFIDQAEEAMKFYASLFPGSEVGKVARYSEAGAKMSGRKAGSAMMVEAKIADINIMGLNGGPMFKFTPSMSFTVHCKDAPEVETLWGKLSKGGTVRMALDKYPWAEKYGWTTDQYGVEWQITTSDRKEKIVPSLLFVDELFGRGEEALKLYTSLFPNAKINMEAKDEKTKSLMYASFTLDEQGFALMEGQGQHGHKFNEAFSIVITCKDQKEIDHYYDALAKGGTEQPCGWVKDKFGVCWQVVPQEMGKIMDNPAKNEKVMSAMFGMKKLDIAKLKAAASEA
jgi:predicted 3-demethylubiquinone-9 3-methyltransferase (glyoxalase superfamily)